LQSDEREYERIVFRGGNLVVSVEIGYMFFHLLGAKVEDTHLATIPCPGYI
jgi:hypothetical protein